MNIDAETLRLFNKASKKLDEDAVESLWQLPEAERRALGQILALSREDLGELRKEIHVEILERHFRLDTDEEGEGD